MPGFSAGKRKDFIKTINCSEINLLTLLRLPINTAFSPADLSRERIKSTPTTPMNKAELIDAVQNTLGGETSKRAAGDAVEAVLQAISGSVAKGDSVQLVGFGTFKVAHRKARTGRNPKTGEPMAINASKTVRFVCSSALKKSL
jgi:DNA-binding protein HU-beta